MKYYTLPAILSLFVLSTSTAAAALWPTNPEGVLSDAAKQSQIRWDMMDMSSQMTTNTDWWHNESDEDYMLPSLDMVDWGFEPWSPAEPSTSAVAGCPDWFELPSWLGDLCV